MKSFNKFFAFAIVMTGISSISMAQETASASSTATIITPISIAKTTDLSFGNIAVQSTTGGTVVLSPASGRTASAGVTLPAVTGTVAAAQFKVDGVGTSAYSITFPNATFNLSTGGATPSTMAVSALTSTPSGNGALTAGTQNVTVGATLTVAAAQPAGTYTNASDLKVTVNYN